MSFDPERLMRDYGSIELEAEACRRRCALFDFSFLMRGRVCGPGALSAVGALTGRRLDDLAPGRIRYALRTDGDGLLLADLTVWNLGDGSYEVMSGRQDDIRDLVAVSAPGTRCQDLSSESGVLALQGPDSLDALAGLTPMKRLVQLPYFGHMTAEIAGVPCRIGRLGYTGEPGFEIVLPREARDRIWDLLAERARPAGFAAADCLRIEAGFVLFANEFRFPVTAREAGLDRFGSVVSNRPRVKLVCFRARTRERPVLWQPAPNARLPAERRHITVTSACHSAVASGTLGLGYVLAEDARPGTDLVDPSGAFHDVRIVPLPFFDHHKERPRRAWT